jgi:hypothetical protein
MKRKILIIVLVVVVLGVLIRPVGFYRLIHPPSKQDVIQKVFKSQQLFEVVNSAKDVTVQRLHLKENGNGYEGGRLSDYDKDAPVPVSPDMVEKIKTLWESPSSYLWGVGSGCIPDYGVLFVFRSGGRTVRVALCFKCNIVDVFDGEEDKAEAMSGGLFDPMRQSMVRICQGIFPGDKEIQGLK